MSYWTTLTLAIAYALSVSFLLNLVRVRVSRRPVRVKSN